MLLFRFAECADRSMPFNQFAAFYAFPVNAINLTQRPGKTNKQKEWWEKCAENAPERNAPTSVGGNNTTGDPCNNDNHK